MPFVFAASKLPFDNITDDCAAALHRDDGCGVDAADVAHLSLWHRCMLVAVLPVVQQRDAQQGQQQEHDKKATRVTHEQLALALRIVEQLDDLDVAYDEMRSATAGDCDHMLSAEEQREHAMLQQLLHEHIAQRERAGAYDRRDSSDDASDSDASHSATSSRDDDDKTNKDDNNNTCDDDDDSGDLVMCFTDDGDSIGIGTTGVFGCHGYHV